MPESGAEGVIIAQGGSFAGWSLYAKGGKPVYCYNLLGVQRFKVAGDTAIPAGEHQVRMEFAYDGGGLAKGGTATLYIDGEQVGEGRIGATIPMIFSADETTDVGSDTGTRGQRRLHLGRERLHGEGRVGADRHRRGCRGRRSPDHARGAPPGRDGSSVEVERRGSEVCRGRALLRPPGTRGAALPRGERASNEQEVRRP